MIKYAIAVLFSMGMMQAQDQSFSNTNTVKVGDEYQIGRPAEISYRHIEFPGAIEIVRKGGNPNLKSVEGLRVIVTSVKQNKEGKIIIKLKCSNGARFFGSYYTVTADFESALKSGELEG